jgi:hypothetical protein
VTEGRGGESIMESTNDGDEAPLKSEARENGVGGGRAGATLALVVALVTPGLLVWAWSLPVAVAPSELPPLVLDPSEVERALRDAAAAASAAPDDAISAERRRLYEEANVAEHEGVEPAGRGRARKEELLRALAALIAAHGPEVVQQTRARDLEGLEPALRGAIAAGDRVAVLGGFVTMMRRYGLARGDRQIAPRFVVRTLFAARWNALHDRELTDGFSPIEHRAYWGWLALRAEDAPVERRLDALERFARAGGTGHAEARAILLFREGRLDEAREAFAAAHAAEPTFRLQNHLLAAAEPAP